MHSPFLRRSWLTTLAGAIAAALMLNATLGHAGPPDDAEAAALAKP